MDEKELKARLQKFELEYENTRYMFNCMDTDLSYTRKRLREYEEKLARLEKNEEKLHFMHSVAIIAVSVGLILHAVL